MRRLALPTQMQRAIDPARETHSCIQECPMLDVIMLALGLGFFALSVGYAYACERL